MATEPLYRKFADAREIENPPEGAILCWVVPMEPCVHGRIDAHWGPHYVADANGHDREYREWCKGAMEVSDGE